MSAPILALDNWLRGGAPLMQALADIALPSSDHASYRLLGLVGYYLAACQRHEAFTLAPGEGGRDAAWKISQRLGAALNVAPRFVFAHQSLFNDASGGRFRTFTSLPDDEVFVRYNILGVLAYERAAHAVRGIADIGVTNVAAAYLFDAALSDCAGSTLSATRHRSSITSCVSWIQPVRRRCGKTTPHDSCACARPTARPTRIITIDW